MNKRAPRSTVVPGPKPPERVHDPGAPTEAEARARLATFRSPVDALSREEFDALVAVAAEAEDRMNRR